MPYKGVVVTIKESAYQKIKAEYERRTKGNIAFTTWLTNYILEHLEEDELLSRYAPGLELIGVEYDTAFIKDTFIDRIAEVVIRDKGVGKRFLYCRHCERDDCLHVGFCFAVREINKVLVERGFKQPKVRKDG
jgi:hypothetical protein